MMPKIDRDLLPDRLRKDRKRSSKGLVLAVILIAVLMLSAIGWLVAQMGNSREPLPSKSATTDYSMLNGNEFSGSGGYVVSSPPYVYLGFWSGGIFPGTEGWASWYFSVNPAPPTYALTISFLYTDTSMGGGGPSVYIYNHATLFWDLVASNIGHGTNVQKSYAVSTNHISSIGGVNVKITDSYGARISWVEVVWSYTEPDTTPPTCTITLPTSNPTFSTSLPMIGLGGSASDNVGVTSVTWYNAATGGSGTASGTTDWGVTSNIPLVSGSNVITVTAHDAAGNTGSDTITVTYAPSIPEFGMMPFGVMVLMAVIVIAGEARRKKKS